MFDDRMPSTMLDVFTWGMDRRVSDILPFPTGPVLNLGAGPKLIPNTIPLDADRGWQAGERLPFESESVAAAYAFHFFEHLTKDEVIGVVQELERVLIVGGSFITVTPHQQSEVAYHDLDHKSFWTEQTWVKFFATEYVGRDGEMTPMYRGTMKRDWRFEVHTVMIMGLVFRNIATVTQIVKTG